MFFKFHHKIKYITISLALFLVFGFSHELFAQENTISSTVSLGSYQPIVAGESLPVYIQLLNFGTPGEKVDVSLVFSVYDSSDVLVLDRTETVAVQTTASFTRYFTIPESLNPGDYTLKLNVAYLGKKFPAISEQQFTIEKDFLGYGVSDWYKAIPFGLLPFVFVVIVWRQRRSHHEVQRDYSHVAKHQPTHYEIIHDIIDSLHYSLGGKEVEAIVNRIPGLSINEMNGHIEEISGPTEVILSQLIREYENTVGKKANIINQKFYPKKRIESH